MCKSLKYCQRDLNHLITQSTPNGKLSTTPQPNLNKVRNIMNAFEESHNLKLKTSLNHPVTQGLEGTSGQTQQWYL